jgi:hypothetical protein
MGDGQEGMCHSVEGVDLFWRYYFITSSLHHLK